MFTEQILPAPIASRRSAHALATPLLRDVVELRALLDTLRQTLRIREVAAADIKQVSARVDDELPRYRVLAARFERTTDPSIRRRLQSSLQRLHNLRFAQRTATAAVERADRQIDRIRLRIRDLRIPATVKAA